MVSASKPPGRTVEGKTLETTMKVGGADLAPTLWHPAPHWNLTKDEFAIVTRSGSGWVGHLGQIILGSGLGAVVALVAEGKSIDGILLSVLVSMGGVALWLVGSCLPSERSQVIKQVKKYFEDNPPIRPS